MAQGQWQEAAKAYVKLIEHNPKDAVNFNNLAWLLATCPDPTIRVPSRAVDLAKKAVELAPKEGNYWNTLGVAQYRAGDYGAALPALEKSMALQGGNPFDWFFLAMAGWQQVEKTDARKWYGQAVEWMEKTIPKMKS